LVARQKKKELTAKNEEKAKSETAEYAEDADEKLTAKNSKNT